MSRRRWWFTLSAVGACLLAAGGAAIYAWLNVDLPAPGELPRRTAAPSSAILDRHGQLLYEVIDPHLGKHSPLPLERIPLALRQATIATEDARFYTNPGVELRGIVRSLWINLRGGDVLAGGSTITQQVARNVLLSPQERATRTLTRKLRESILAYRLTRTYTKDQILATYLNEVYYGNMAYGVEAAAQAYYDKSVDELDLAECAMLAGLPQAPALYNPLVDLEAAQRRQRTVLDLMVKEGYISAQEADMAAAERLQFAAAPFAIRAPHFVTYVWALLEREMGVEALARGGWTVHTTLDVDLQERAQAIVQRHLRALGADRAVDRNVNNAALLALDPQTGDILAMVGSADYFEGAISGAVNTTLSLRQPGSAIKPVTYAAAFDPAWLDQPARATRWGTLPFTAATVVVDVRTAFVTREGIGYVPLNYDLRWHGPVLLREALASSYNLPAVKVLDAIGVETMIAQAQAMGITTFDAASERFGRALTLGGGEVSMIELAAAYGVFATGGDLVTPRALLDVVDAEGHTAYAPPVERRAGVLDPRVAYLITDILSDPYARLPAFGEGSALDIGRPAAAKTGTTTDWRDNWTVGYTPDLLAAVWAGNADNAPMVHVSGITGAGPIWHDLMTWALKDRPARAFRRPDGLVEVEVCALSGQLPTPACTHRQRELFIEGTAPTERCDLHELIPIDVATGLRATASTPADRVRERIYVAYPPEAQAWAIGQGIPAPPPAAVGGPSGASPAGDGAPDGEDGSHGPWSPGEQAGAGTPIEIVSPFQMDRYRMSRALPAEDQRLMIEARPGGSVRFASVTLFVDGEPLATLSQAPYRLWWQLRPGTHAIHAVGETAEGRAYASPPVTLVVEE
ncbi:MAG: transglycosylase domain-containing protein [Anaerolineae bacterium]|nr:transglycosylase domain-containing protein [Anaerolineae bacterium]